LLYITGAVRFLNRRHLHHHLQDNHAITNNQQLPAATNLPRSSAGTPSFSSNVELECGSTFENTTEQKWGECSAPQAVISEFDQETLYNPVTARLYNRGACVSAFAAAANCSKSRAHEGTFFIRKNLLHRALPLQPQEQCHQLHK
jgi:hypothetical protein